MVRFRGFAIVPTLMAILCMAPGISVLATSGQSDRPSCCQPASPCGTGLMAADCCRADRLPQADTPAAGPVTMTKKQLKVVDQPDAVRIADDGIAAASAAGARSLFDPRADARAPSPPLFLTHAALLI